jgi:hypothetical protein
MQAAPARQQCRYLLGRIGIQARDAVLVFAGLLCLETVQCVAAAAGMRVDVAERRRLGLHRLDQREQHGVLQDIGEVAGVVGVAVIHGGHGGQGGQV